MNNKNRGVGEGRAEIGTCYLMSFFLIFSRSSIMTLMVEGVPYELANSETRKNCLEAYTFLLESIDKVKFLLVTLKILNFYLKFSKVLYH